MTPRVLTGIVAALVIFAIIVVSHHEHATPPAPPAVSHEANAPIALIVPPVTATPVPPDVIGKAMPEPEVVAPAPAPVVAPDSADDRFKRIEPKQKSKVKVRTTQPSAIKRPTNPATPDDKCKPLEDAIGTYGYDRVAGYINDPDHAKDPRKKAAQACLRKHKK